MRRWQELMHVKEILQSYQDSLAREINLPMPLQNSRLRMPIKMMLIIIKCWKRLKNGGLAISDEV
jgi:hypothetical protein